MKKKLGLLLRSCWMLPPWYALIAYQFSIISMGYGRTEDPELITIVSFWLLIFTGPAFLVLLTLIALRNYRRSRDQVTRTQFVLEMSKIQRPQLSANLKNPKPSPVSRRAGLKAYERIQKQDT